MHIFYKTKKIRVFCFFLRKVSLNLFLNKKIKLTYLKFFIKEWVRIFLLGNFYAKRNVITSFSPVTLPGRVWHTAVIIFF